MSVAISVSCKRAVVPFRELRLSPSGGNEATASSRTQHGGRRRHEDSRQHEQAVAQDGRKIARDRSRSRRATAISTSFTSPSPISAITLCVRSRSRTSTLSTRSRQARGSSAARLPPAIDRPRRFAQAAPVCAPNPPFDRGIKPQRHENRRIGGRWSGVPRTRASNQGRPVLGGVRATPAMSASTTCLAISVAPPGPRMQLKRHAAQPVEPSLAMPAHSV